MRKQSSITVIAWRKLSRRSELLAQALNGKLLFFKDKPPYIRAAFKTLINVIQQKPRILVLQLPQGPLLLEAYFLKKLVGCKIVADVHTGFLLNTDWKGLILNAPFVKLLSLADIVVAHNETQLEIIPKNVKNKTIVVYDPWNFINTEGEIINKQEKYIVFPASFASDEPLIEIIEAVNTSKQPLKLYITGNWRRSPEVKKYTSEKIQFTGFLPNQKFKEILAGASAVITGTTREYTTMMSAWEAIAYNKPLAVTTTKTLKNMYAHYAIFYNWKNKQNITKALQTINLTHPNPKSREELKQKTIQSLELLKQKIKEN
ncbi:MAG: glycosyltransferase [Candidatus Bathyarchaeota archaeon]|nr:glycosyltransferase [Candidatus Termiticorpusculum sp.]MCL1970345.1 glycosyltransferase [Candidatus Termiticorpusculum sp.]